jgi:hypothetical protein
MSAGKEVSLTVFVETESRRRKRKPKEKNRRILGRFAAPAVSGRTASVRSRARLMRLRVSRVVSRWGRTFSRRSRVTSPPWPSSATAISSEWFRISSTTWGVWRVSGARERMEVTRQFSGWTANCACEKKQQNRRSGRERGRGSRPRSRANARRREGCTYHRIDFARVVRARRARRLGVRLVAQRDITAPLRLGGPQRHHRAGVRPPPRARRAGRLPPRARPSRSRSTERRASSPAARLNLR